MSRVLDQHVPLVVVGGGLAGTVAAIAAARAGTRTTLIQERPVLGGNSSSEVRVNPVGATGSGYRRDARETGIMEELFLDVRARSFGLRQSNGRHYPMWDVILAEKAEAEPNLTLHLNTRVIDVETEDDTRAGYATRITRLVAVQQGTEAVFNIVPEMVIDATGDGFVARQAGAPFRYGREGQSEFGESMAPEVADDVVLGSSIMFAARDVDRPVPFVPPSWAHSFPDEASLPFRKHEELESGYWWIEWGGQCDTIADNEAIRKELHAAIFGVWDHIKNHCTVPGVRERAATWTLDWIGHLPGKRESRRFEGDHILTQQELIAGLSDVPADSVAYGGWPIDLHAPDGIYAAEKPCTQPQPPTVYGIPLRTLYSRSVSNLFLAGRNISQTHVAHGSTRVMKTCAVIGQGAGTAASFAISANLTPRELAQDESRLCAVQQHLLRSGAYLPTLQNHDPLDLARAPDIRITTSSSALLLVDLDPHALPRWEYFGLSTPEPDSARFHRTRPVAPAKLDQRHGQAITISSDHIDTVSLCLTNDSSDCIDAMLEIAQARHLWDFGNDLSAETIIAKIHASVPPGTANVDFPLEMPLAVVPNAPVVLLLDAAPHLSWERTLQEPPGTQAGRWDDEWQWWRWLRGTLGYEITPVSSPYFPENVVNGITRPEVGPNMWISDPGASLPQWVELRWPRPHSIGRVELTFDSQLSGWVWEGVFPSVARSYTIETHDPERDVWRIATAVSDNYQRRREHCFPQQVTDAIRITINATNGGITSRIIEVRAYPGEAPGGE